VTVRCRFAPAPSGSIHVGNARSALFSWAYARRHEGSFVLRVEDTDASRVTEEAYRGVLDSLRWLGIDWDEGPDVGGPQGPYRQSQRMGTYREHVDRLLSTGHAYRCYCTDEERKAREQAAKARGEPAGYDGPYYRLTDQERAAYEAEGRPAAVRCHMPEHEWVVQDLVKGEVRWDAGQLRDFVLLRSDGTPLFLLAVAVDDMLMEVTHVVRGDDLLSAAPQNIAVIEALGGRAPAYAHLPQVVGPDRKPLSKRHGSTSLEAFREQGYLPEALMNYLALLGWSKDAETTIFSREELIGSFDLARVSSNPAAFDVEKLTWVNTHYIQSLDDDDLAARCLHFLSAEGLTPDPQVLKAAMPLVKERMRTLTEAPALLAFLFSDDVRPNEKAAQIIGRAPDGYLGALVDGLDVVEDWTAEQIPSALDRVAEAHVLNRTKGWQPARAAVTGSNVSPPLPESLALLGKERTLARLRAFSR